MDFIAILAAVTVSVIAWAVNKIAGAVVTAAALGYIVYKAYPIMMALKGKKAYAAGDRESACRAYGRAIKTGRANSVIQLEYSDLLMQTGRTDKAKDFLDGMLRKKLPNDTRNVLKLRRCMAYFQQGNKEEAYSDAEEIYNDGFKTTYLYALLGFFKLDRDGKSEDTFNFCKEAFEYNDSDRDITDNYALALYYKGEYDRADGIYNVMTEKHPAFVEGFYHGALAAYEIGNYKKTAEYLDKTEECKWSPMTTVTKEEVSELKSAALDKLGVK